MDIQEQLITLVHLINTDQFFLISELTAIIVSNSLCLYEKSTTYLSILYQLIFYTYKYNPTAACHILNGFIQFGYSEYGTIYKPMLDYFVVEAYTGLVEIGGWSVLKPCVLVLRASNPNYLNDFLFQHILAETVKQLKQDENDKSYSSNLCYNLPREKSFSWGWFSYDLARAYYSKNEILTPNQLRNCMMLYRKLLTGLRKKALNTIVYQPETQSKLEENWTDLLNALSHYTWASAIIKNTINDNSIFESMPVPLGGPEPAQEPAQEVPVPVPAQEEPEPAQEEPEPAPAQEHVPAQEEPVLVPAQEPVEEKKNTSWFSWLGLA